MHTQRISKKTAGLLRIISGIESQKYRNNGGIEKASTNLIAYEKTELLEPGESETVEITFDYEDMASYDEYNNQCYVLEHGEYVITLNSDSHTVLDSETFTLDEDIIYNDENDGARSTDETTATNQFEDAVISYCMGGNEVKGATEQAIREIYLKAFEGAIKEGGSLGVMSSFNSIGTEWAGANDSLLVSVLREEWGFHGAVITD